MAMWKLLGRALRWTWRRLADIQTVEWIYQGGLSAIVSTIAIWLVALGRQLQPADALSVAVAFFTVALSGFRFWRSRRLQRLRAQNPLLVRSIIRADTPPVPPGNQPLHIRRDLGKLIKEGEEFAERRLSISAASMFERIIPEAIWSAQVIEWRNRSLGYLNDAGLDETRFAECSPPEVKALTLDQVRCYVERLRESL